MCLPTSVQIQHAHSLQHCFTHPCLNLLLWWFKCVALHASMVEMTHGVCCLCFLLAAFIHGLLMGKFLRHQLAAPAPPTPSRALGIVAHVSKLPNAVNALQEKLPQGTCCVEAVCLGGACNFLSWRFKFPGQGTFLWVALETSSRLGKPWGSRHGKPWGWRWCSSGHPNQCTQC